METNHTVIITKVRRITGIFIFSVFRTVENMEAVKDGGRIRDKRRLEKNYFLSVNFSIFLTDCIVRQLKAYFNGVYFLIFRISNGSVYDIFERRTQEKKEREQFFQPFGSSLQVSSGTAVVRHFEKERAFLISICCGF